jgi:hypothetical protein
MREHGRIHQDAIDRLDELSKRTKNFSGAEIEGIDHTHYTHAPLYQHSIACSNRRVRCSTVILMLV